jgi:hypothetical protein
MRNQTEYLQQLFSEFKDENDPLQSRFTIESSFPLPDCYPHLFTSLVNEDGFISHQSPSEPAKSLPILTRMQSGSELKSTIDHQLKCLDRIVFADFYEYSQGECALSKEDFLETKEALITLSDVYTNDDDNMMM